MVVWSSEGKKKIASPDTVKLYMALVSNQFILLEERNSFYKREKLELFKRNLAKKKYGKPTHGTAFT